MKGSFCTDKRFWKYLKGDSCRWYEHGSVVEKNGNLLRKKYKKMASGRFCKKSVAQFIEQAMYYPTLEKAISGIFKVMPDSLKAEELEAAARVKISSDATLEALRCYKSISKSR